MAKLSKNINEFLNAGGWSATLFLEHAKLAFTELKGKAIVDVGRTVIHTMTCDAIVKCYVHYKGKTPEWLTLTDKKGVELASFHHTTSPADVVAKLKELLKIKK